MEITIDYEKFIYIDTNLCLSVNIKYFKKLKNYENFLKYIFSVIDKTIELRTQHLKCSTIDAYVNLKDYKVKELDYEFIKGMIRFCEEKYPDNLRIIYIKNANFMIKSIYSIIRPFVHKDTRKKLIFIKKKKNKDKHKKSEINTNEEINEANIDSLFE
jgi:hypothetical protein|tara:strand:+ start:518 stop:991 length:474 start_codon:yes stop_codon:yes gene_type:complete